MGGNSTTYERDNRSSYEKLLDNIEEKATVFEYNQEEIESHVADILSTRILSTSQLLSLRGHLNRILYLRIKESGFELDVNLQKLGLEGCRIEFEKLVELEEEQQKKKIHPNLVKQEGSVLRNPGYGVYLLQNKWIHIPNSELQ